MPRCLSSLALIRHAGYSPAAERRLTGDRRRFPARLAFTRAQADAFRHEFLPGLGLPGSHEKVPVFLWRGQLQLAEQFGDYILKMAPSAGACRFPADKPANEHLTMQLAGQIFGIAAAANACLRFADGEPAYIVRRFDRRRNYVRLAQEDFAQLAERMDLKLKRDTNSYEEAGRILRKCCPAYAVEAGKLFARVVFNGLVSNREADLTDLSVGLTEYGDPILTPAYDLACTALHEPAETAPTLSLFDNPAIAPTPVRADYLKLAAGYGLNPVRAAALLDRFSRQGPAAEELVAASFLSAPAKEEYRARFLVRLKAIGAGA